jgi:hypothetical protein
MMKNFFTTIKKSMVVSLGLLILGFGSNAMAQNTVVDVIVNSPDHETLEDAVIAAGLVETLNGDGPFTVFAPTDAAFDALPEGTLTTLLEDPTGGVFAIQEDGDAD